MILLDIIAAIVLLGSVIWLLICYEVCKSEFGDIQSTITVVICNLIRIAVKFKHTEFLPTQSVNRPIKVFNSPGDWKAIKPAILVKMVVEWGRMNIVYGKSRRITPNIKINYSKNGTILGSYYFHSKLIEVHFRKHKTFESIVETILHEYVHHLQLRNQGDDMKYDSNSRKVGYYDNPFEVEARELARKYRMKCIADLNMW